MSRRRTTRLVVVKRNAGVNKVQTFFVGSAQGGHPDRCSVKASSGAAVEMSVVLYCRSRTSQQPSRADNHVSTLWEPNNIRL